MSRNQNGTYFLPDGNPVVPGELITAEWANETLDDVAAALTQSLDRSGLGGMTGQLKLADGTETNPAMAFTLEVSTGLYRKEAGTLGLAVLATDVAEIRKSGITMIDDAVIVLPNAPLTDTQAANKGYVDTAIADNVPKPDLSLVVKQTSATGAALMPVGTSNQAPAVGAVGMMRVDTQLNAPVWFNPITKAWEPMVAPTVDEYYVNYMIVSGGGSGGVSDNDPYASAGGGGGGGVTFGMMRINKTVSYPIIIGKGAAFPNGLAAGNNGGASSSFGVSVPGGGGGLTFSKATTYTPQGGAGACGGGGVSTGYQGSGFTANGSVGLLGGSGGGAGSGEGAYNGGGGGGGMGGNGGNAGPADHAQGGTGGNGAVYTPFGQAGAYYCAGGAGSGGGAAGIGAGSIGSGSNGVSFGAVAAAAKDGITYIWYAGEQIGRGGVVTTVNGFTVHTFAQDGDFKGGVANYAVNYVLVGGGGAGGSTGLNYAMQGLGAGAAGQVLQGTTTITSDIPYEVTIGSGGGPTANANGGAGAATAIKSVATAAGGSGNFGGAGGTSGAGFGGGPDYGLGNGGGGGGGSSAASTSKNGGAGTTVTIATLEATLAGGGGGGGLNDAGAGAAGGGNGNLNDSVGGNGGSATANSGSGGGGATCRDEPHVAYGGSGGSGRAVVFYKGDPIAIGGTITQVGGYTIHTFLASGLLTPL